MPVADKQAPSAFLFIVPKLLNYKHKEKSSIIYQNF
jgi:hypothetical protein